MRSEIRLIFAILAAMPAVAPAQSGDIDEWSRRIVESQSELYEPIDDLTRIAGVGPKISNVLRGAGIATYAQLAATDVAQLKQILAESGIRVADPGTWPEQARLAAAGDWDALERLQGQLKGGRLV